jgi:hypothetical protein
MAMTWMTTGKALILENTLGKTAVDGTSNWKMHLFSNNASITAATVVGDLTEVATTGYAVQNMPPADWTLTTVTTDDKQAACAKKTFTMSVATTSYGYFVTNAAGTTLIGAENFGEAYVLGSSGGTINVTLTAILNNV